MAKRLIGTIAVGVLVVAGVPEYASAFDQPIGTKISLIKPGSLYKIVSKPVSSYPIPAVGPDDPLHVGGSLEVTLNGGSLTCTLAGGLWKGLGNPAGSSGWKYVNAAAPSGSACKLVLIKEKVIKVLTKATGTLVVNGPGANGDLYMQLDAGSDMYCALGEPSYLVEKAGTLLKEKDAPPPGSCVPPTTTTIAPTTTTTITTTTTTTTLGPCADTSPECNGTCPPDTECRGVGGGCECVEVDFFPSSLAEVDVRLPCGSEVPNIVQLQGPTEVHVFLERLADTDGDGREQVPTEIVAMELTGPNPFGSGTVTVRLRDAAKDPFHRITGEVEEGENTQLGRLDLPPFGPEGGAPADSFFDVFFEVELPGPVKLHNHDPKPMRATISHKPPAPGEVYENPDFIDLFTEHWPADPDGCFAQIGPGWHMPNPTTTTTTSPTTTVPTTTVPATTTTTLPPNCVCSTPGVMVFETTIGSGTAGTLRNYRCSGGDPNLANGVCDYPRVIGDPDCFPDNACDPDIGNPDCDFSQCYNPPGMCAGDFAIGCLDDSDCQGTCGEISGGNLPLALEKGGPLHGWRCEQRATAIPGPRPGREHPQRDRQLDADPRGDHPSSGRTATVHPGPNVQRRD